MQRIILALIFLFSGVVQAQTYELDMARADIRTAKMSMIGLAMALTSEQQDAFWPIYNEYAKEQDSLMSQRMQMLSAFIDDFSTLTEAQARQLAADSFEIQKARIKRREVYFERFAVAIGPVLAARFIQVDGQISTLLDFELMQATPLIVPPLTVEVQDN